MTTRRATRKRASLLRLAACCGVAFACLGGCRRAQPASAKPQARAHPRTPTETIQQLLAARAAADAAAMERLIVPGKGRGVVQLLHAVDAFAQANRELCDYVRDHYSLELAEAIDQSRLGNHLGVFSPDVAVVSEQTRGDEASVAFSVGGTLPLRHARLVRAEGAWRYDPGPGYDPNLPRAFDQMARGLRGLLDDLKRPPLATRVQNDPRLLLEEVARRLAPGVKLLPGHGG